MYRSFFPLILLVAATAAEAQSSDVNGVRTDQKQGTSAYIKGNEGRSGTTIGGIGISEKQDIRRTSSGKLNFSRQKLAALKAAAQKAGLQKESVRCLHRRGGRGGSQTSRRA